MNALFVSIAYNLRRLFDFGGRETQILFWPYAGFIYGLATVASLGLIMVPIMTMVVGMMQQIKVAAEQGGNAEPAFVAAPEMLIPNFSGLVLPLALIDLLTILLLAAAIARRFHDKDRSGLWGLLPVPSMLLGLALMPSSLPAFFTSREPNPLMALVLLNNMASLGLFVALVVLLVGKGSTGPNRFGEAIDAPG